MRSGRIVRQWTDQLGPFPPYRLDASSIVLRGYELPTDCQIVRPGERYFDDRGLEMWNTVTRLLAKLEARSA
jgi:hypothetical protein